MAIGQQDPREKQASRLNPIGYAMVSEKKASTPMNSCVDSKKSSAACIHALEWFADPAAAATPAKTAKCVDALANAVAGQVAAHLQAATEATGVAVRGASSLDFCGGAIKPTLPLKACGQNPMSFAAERHNKQARFLQISVADDSPLHRYENVSKGCFSEREQQLLNCMAASFAAVQM
ncbi:hypothetical protein cyc_05438 [Cyclospora cayetanensis]|uniref:Uncharacterized protein n=1 Tax=Cyclospora cayetanensis TaxID=88456 RepID=A0A1D3CXG1_9EIME|nr:hypothetical protein cyc_05438 [Cyclospora cayetanensis]